MERLVGIIQPYAWGDPDFLAALQGRLPSGRPEAELWFGTHAGGPSVLEPSGRLLSDALAGAGQPDLPFLVKILASAQPLSIQTHPSAAQARDGFAREEAAGVAHDDPRRIYRDPHPKPELVCALTPFAARCGFRDLDHTRELFDLLGQPALAPVRALLGTQGQPAEVLRATVAWLLSLDPARSRDVAAAAVVAAQARPGGRFADDLRWTVAIHRAFPGDAGVVVALLLNHVELQPGDAVFLDAGNLHCYLQGAAVEVMGNSDNVVRGGLTAKHVDVDELLAITDCSPITPPVQRGGGTDHAFAVAAPEFAVTRMAVSLSDTPREMVVAGPEIVLATAGRIRLRPVGWPALVVGPGQAAFVAPADTAYEIDGDGLCWRVTTNSGNSYAAAPSGAPPHTNSGQ